MSRQAEKVFITGATGFIGANLTRFLLKKGYDVHILLRKSSKISPLLEIKKMVTFHKGDLNDFKNSEILINKIKPDYIFHLSSYGNSSEQTDLIKMTNSNIVDLVNLLEASKKINYKSFVIAGSSSEYGFKKTPMKEADFLEPNGYYSATKASATLIAQSFAKENNKPIRILRLFSVFGPYENEKRLIPVVIKNSLSDKQILLTKEIIKRDFIFVDDVVDAFHKAMKNKTPNGAIFNIGTGKQSDNKDIVKSIEKIFNKKLKVRLGGFSKRKWDTNFWVASTTKSNKILKWKAKTSLQEGLRKTIDWTTSR